jgi:transposase-like protein
MQRKKFDATTKAKVALEAAKGARTANEIAGQYDCHPTQVSQWKKELLEAIPTLFENRKKRKDVTADADHDEALRQIGQLQMELAWLKKKSAQLRS